jgi:enoyl-CoA hydratase/carnithine racemase
MSLSLKLEDGIAWLSFDHGKANEMGKAQLDAFVGICQRLENGEARVLVSYSRRRSSKGTPIFIAGANVTERVGWSRDEVAAHVRFQRDVLRRVRALPLFHVAVINGVALGWGTEYAMTADYRIGCSESVYGLPETGLGILPGAGGSSELWSQIGLAQALRLGMTGERISAEEAHRIGLVQELQPDVDAGLARAAELGARVSRNSPTAVAAFKRTALAAVGRSESERVELEAQAYEHCLDSGEAAIGRSHFANIRAGETVPWGPLEPFKP